VCSISNDRHDQQSEPSLDLVVVLAPIDFHWACFASFEKKSPSTQQGSIIQNARLIFSTIIQGGKASAPSALSKLSSLRPSSIAPSYASVSSVLHVLLQGPLNQSLLDPLAP